MWNVSFYETYVLKIQRQQILTVESMLFTGKTSWGMIVYVGRVVVICLNMAEQTFTVSGELISYTLWVATLLNKLKKKRSMTIR